MPTSELDLVWGWEECTSDPRNTKASLAGKAYKTKVEFRPRKDRNRWSSMMGPSQSLSSRDGSNKSTQEPGARVDLLRQALSREAGMWRSMSSWRQATRKGYWLWLQRLCSTSLGILKASESQLQILVSRMVEEICAVIKQSLLIICLSWRLSSFHNTLGQPRRQDLAAEAPSPHTSGPTPLSFSALLL